MHDKTDIIQALKVHYTFTYSKAETNQLIEGLETVGIMDALKMYSSIKQVYFFQVEQLNASK